MTKEEIKQYLKDNLKLSWEHKNGNYYIILKLDGEKVTELNFGEGYWTITNEEKELFNEYVKAEELETFYERD